MSPALPVGLALAAARSVPFWLDDPLRPDPMPALQGDARADLAIVGGGFAGLWAALEALERDPGREVVLLEGGVVGIGASGRNGGFCAATLTHGHENRVCQRSRCPCVTLRRPSAVPGRPPHGGRLLGEIDAR